MCYAGPRVNGFNTYPSFAVSLLVMFSCFLRAPKIVSLCLEEVR